MLNISSHMTTVRKLLGVATVALAASLATLAAASPALATPTGDYAVFADCPLSTASECVWAKTESGKLVVAKETVPIFNAITLQGGFTESEEMQHFVGAADGNTLSKSPQKIPGGLAGLVRCYEINNEQERKACEAIFENKVTGVNATTELAAPASSIGISTTNYFIGSGAALTLPVKLHLENPLLGSSCYVGSNASPIIVELTTGTSGAVTGSTGNFEIKGEGEIIAFSDNSLVNNTFAAPGANGCGASGLLDPLVNGRLGLPSEAGHNTAVLNGTIEQTSVEAVKAHG